MTNLAIQAKTTKTAQFLGADVDISGIAGDWTLVLEVLAMNSGDTARFVFEDSDNATTTYNTDIFPGPAFSVSGQIVSSAPRRFTVTKKDFPNLRFGVTSAVLRLNLTEITGSSKSVTYQAWVEY